MRPLRRPAVATTDSRPDTRLLDAFDIQILWNIPGRQATGFAEITNATLQALPAILSPARTVTMTLPNT